jgi:hypothetical protein
MDITFQVKKIKEELLNRNLNTTYNHFEQIILNIQQNNWESANAQIRSFLESLFNDVCLLVLHKSKTGGSARIELQKAGVIDELHANNLYSFMQLSHTKGSHPGVSNENETFSRWFSCLSFALLGISILPNIIRISTVFKLAKISIPNVVSISDEIFGTTCPSCEEKQFLSLCKVFQEAGETHYQCKNGCQDLLIIGKPGEKTITGRGYRLKDFVVRNANDIFLFTPGGIVNINKSPAALKKLKP